MLEHSEDLNKPEHLLEKNQTSSHSLLVLSSISKQSYAEELFKQALNKTKCYAKDASFSTNHW